MSKKVVTHVHVDLDAASCVGLALLQGLCADLEEVALLPADAQTLPEGAIALDHPLGIKGTASALAEMSQSREILGGDFIDEVVAADTADVNFKPKFTLSRLFAAMRTSLRSEGHSPSTVDAMLLKTWAMVVKGIALQNKDRQNAEENCGDVVTVPIGPYTFAMPQDALSPQMGQVLNGMGVTGSIYRDGRFGLGVFRFPGRQEPDLSLLVGKLKGWFVHPAGFLLCWGSRKAPATQPPPKGTPQTVQELIEFLRTVLG